MSSDTDISLAVKHFVNALPIPDPSPWAPAREQSRTKRRHTGWIGAAAAAVLVLLAGVTGVIALNERPVDTGAAPSLVMPERQWGWNTDVSHRPLDRALIVSRITSSFEDAWIGGQTVVGDETGNRAATVPGNEVALVSPDGRHLAVGSRDSATVTLVDVKTGRTTHVTVPSSASQVVPLAWSRDSQRVFVSGTRPAPRHISGLEYAEMSSVDLFTYAVTRLPHLDGATALSTSPTDRSIFAAFGKDSRIIDTETGTVTLRMPGAAGVTFDQDAWSTDGRWIVGTTNDRTALVTLNASTGTRTEAPPVEGYLTGLTWSGDRYLALLNSPATATRAPGATALVALDIPGGHPRELSRSNPGLIRDITYGGSVARDLADRM